MCIQDIPWNNTTIISYWQKVLMFESIEVSWFFMNGQSKWLVAKNIKIELWVAPTTN
jgi:hypothetical protein